MRSWIRHWAIPLSWLLHATAVGAMVMRFEPPPQLPVARPVALSVMEPAVEDATEARTDPDPVTAAPPPPPEVKAVDIPTETVKATPPPAPEVPLDTPAVIETKAVEAPVVAAVPPKVIKAKPKPAPVAETKLPPVEDAQPAFTPPPPMKPVDTAMAPASVAPARAKTEMKASAGGVAGPPPEYLDRLRLRLERAKIYPRAAQLRRQEGVTQLRFTVDRQGKVLAWKIEKSSGFDLLDREVEAMLKRAQPLPPLPDSMELENLELVVPVQFFLRQG